MRYCVCRWNASGVLGPFCSGAFFHLASTLVMSHSALFVDAGYLLAGAHGLLGGTVSRSAFTCGYGGLLDVLRGKVEEHGPGLTFLRTYWYDGARDGIPTADHRLIGGLPYVKVRVGRLTQRGQQKGVDGLIYRDISSLARGSFLPSIVPATQTPPSPAASGPAAGRSMQDVPFVSGSIRVTPSQHADTQTASSSAAIQAWTREFPG
jgi:hypothetical protein